MMAKHQGMKAEMALLDTKLDSLLTTMNAARGSQKVDATRTPADGPYYLRESVNCPFEKGPLQVLEPEYVPVMVSPRI